MDNLHDIMFGDYLSEVCVKKSFFLSFYESPYYREIKRILDECEKYRCFYIFPKVRLADIFEYKKESKSQENKKRLVVFFVSILSY